MAIVFFLIFPIIILCILSIEWLKSWSKFWSFSAINAISFIVYILYLTQSKLVFFGHDEYVLRKAILILSIVYVHILIIFCFALVRKIRLGKRDRESINQNVHINLSGLKTTSLQSTP